MWHCKPKEEAILCSWLECRDIARCGTEGARVVVGQLGPSDCD